MHLRLALSSIGSQGTSMVSRAPFLEHCTGDISLLAFLGCSRQKASHVVAVKEGRCECLELHPNLSRERGYRVQDT